METHGTPPTRTDQPGIGLDTDRYSKSQEWHLARSERETEITNFEFNLMAAAAAFERCVTQLCHLLGQDLAYNEAVILHVVRMHDRPKDAATIARLLNRDDLPNVQYALRKLVNLGLIVKTKQRGGSYFSTTEAGTRWTESYADLRARIMLTLQDSNAKGDKLDLSVPALALMAATYDAAGRAAAILNPTNLVNGNQET